MKHPFLQELMTETYELELHFREQDITDEEYDDFMNEVEQMDGEIEIKERKSKAYESEHADPATTTALTAGTLLVHGTDVMISLYKLAHSHPGFAHSSIYREDGTQIKQWNEKLMEMEDIDENHGAVIGNINIEGDVTINLVDPSELDRNQD